MFQHAMTKNKERVELPENEIRIKRLYDINDPLGQTNSPASSDHCSHLKIVLFCRILKSVKIVVTTGRDCGSASWIKKRGPYRCSTICDVRYVAGNFAARSSLKLRSGGVGCNFLQLP